MNKILRSIIHICSSFVFVLFILSITGLVSNNRGNSFGFAYRTDYTCFLLTLTIIVLMVRYYRANGGVPFQDKDRYGLISVLFKVLYIPVVLGINFNKVLQAQKACVGVGDLLLSGFCGH